MMPSLKAWRKQAMRRRMLGSAGASARDSVVRYQFIGLRAARAMNKWLARRPGRRAGVPAIQRRFAAT